MSDFCGSEICNLRIGIWFADPSDAGVVDPCRRCRTALEDLLGVWRPRRQKAPILRALYRDLRRAGMVG